ncbi:hypothetical protein QBC34DRAFT_443083 [Podospora aff. communis PSN243]|uniref:Extracellular membrane protein CFEM domain-containing protein n=1 Tax=Podospora aff. communis PSN243 TaxID=3040156 RepID=A0AAV9G6J0_9PEZI|nr:hypothetical protein QBC34DRAFT_443083 [Podospora aff. communis PSN243]
MHLSPSLLLTTLLASAALAQTIPNPPCIQDCVTKNLNSSHCDGDETGEALDRCTCASHLNAPRRFECVKTCSKEDQAIYAGKLPALCREQLLPGITAVTTGSGSSTTTTGTGSGGGGAAATTTTGGGGAAQTSNPAAPAVRGGSVERVVALGGLVGGLLLW